jgi:flagellar basal-body rod protein FlgB
MPGLSPKVLLDLQVARMAQNGVHYQALVAGLTKHFAILSTAVSDGRK